MTWLKGLNEFSDMTDQEFSQYFNINSGAKIYNAAKESNKKSKPLELPYRDVPADWDWRNYNVVTPVKTKVIFVEAVGLSPPLVLLNLTS
jgi:hypothetical protein